MLLENWEQIPEKAGIISEKILEMGGWMVNSNEWFGGEGKDSKNSKWEDYVGKQGIWLKKKLKMC